LQVSIPELAGEESVLHYFPLCRGEPEQLGAAATTTLAYIADYLSVMHKRNTYEVIEENPTYDR
jgi:hypothetical protein